MTLLSQVQGLGLRAGNSESGPWGVGLGIQKLRALELSL